jgi:hypothetical protein
MKKIALHLRSNASSATTAQNSWRANMIPGRLDAAEVAAVLGFKEHDIAILVAEGLLEPLGKPVPNAIKYYAACVVEKLRENEGWLDDATQTLYKHWQAKNQRKKGNEVAPQQEQDIALAE